MEDIYNLERFIIAQDRGTYARALDEIQSGFKISHWMWFVFPQLRGLGHSNTAVMYAVNSIDEAEAYLNHPILGARLREISEALLDLEEDDPKKVMGSPDWLKLRSSMTLFDHISPNDIFGEVLKKYYEDTRCSYTEKFLLRVEECKTAINKDKKIYDVIGSAFCYDPHKSEDEYYNLLNGDFNASLHQDVEYGETRDYENISVIRTMGKDNLINYLQQRVDNVKMGLVGVWTYAGVSSSVLNVPIIHISSPESWVDQGLVLTIKEGKVAKIMQLSLNPGGVIEQ